MVEVIWPLSSAPCNGEGSSEKGVLPLRTYIEETLRRSKTSYSTLQVALYYLVLIKPFVPKSDFTREQRMDCPASRALMCGRRMFLAALILASKYLQDRNYSAKAWSKMSGLKVCEINSHERTFLSKVNWKLHIPEPLFKRWTDIVLDFTPRMPPSSPGQGFSLLPPSWKAIIPLLTPELDKVPTTGLRHKRSTQCMGNYGSSTPTTPTIPNPNLEQLQSMSQEGTPTPTTVLPRFLEPKLDMEPPPVPRMGPLPTPQMTPSLVASSTPAASSCGSRRPSICSAMAMAQKSGFNRCAVDSFPGMLSRRPSITSTSNFSSPESLISDRSRSSRASSISSASTVSTMSSAVAPTRACLARQATCRNAGLPMPPIASVAEEKECDGSVSKPIIVSDSEMDCSPDLADFSISEKVLSRPDKHTKHAPQPPTAPSNVDKGRKRVRNSHGSRRSYLQEEVRWMLEEAEDEMCAEFMDIDDRIEAKESRIAAFDSQIEAHESRTQTLEHNALEASPAVDYARRMLARGKANLAVRTKKETQPPASLSRRGSHRTPVARPSGEKRRCCSTAAERSVEFGGVGGLYGEVA